MAKNPLPPSTEQLESLKKAIVHRLPYCSGTVELPSGGLVLYYGKGHDTRCIDFSNPDEEDLKHLAEACDVATFGVDDKEVNDDSYRKAGKLNTSQFCTNFNVYESGLLSVIRDSFLEGDSAGREIRPELYKLNVYGPGGFFKAHKDTPRGTEMFGSLVLVLPTVHEGGALILRENEDEWTFDSARTINEHITPTIGYVAFWSDVEHEVKPMVSGYRVTATYNLYYGSAPSPKHEIVNPSLIAFKAAMETALADSTFLPEGGCLAFGLRRAYPLDKNQPDLQQLPLKGGDAVIKQACAQLSLDTTTNLIFHEKATYTSDRPVNTYCELVPSLQNVQVYEDDGYGDVLQDRYRGKRGGVDVRVYWVTDVTKYTSFRTHYQAYGNEPSVAYAYGWGCLLVEIGPRDARGTLGNTEKRWKAVEEEKAHKKAAQQELLRKRHEEKLRKAQEAAENKKKKAEKKTQAEASVQGEQI
ncbi:hypothetical protein EIP91_000798 [Steccherinum ochraceum]|uniref:Prolyl 4-hydroxylase alpha subunit domain-containing protein n=1 Tax=Steccherinum ochraceum TaxID=92696 RepID=A0A4R0RVP8_9APHY|nr:hypothetical protein EIP91_000798 [Steccherinum ochraceum]